MRVGMLVAAIGGAMTLTPVAHAASDACKNPTEDMIYKCLVNPGAGRGIHLSGPSASVPAATAPAPAPAAPAVPPGTTTTASSGRPVTPRPAPPAARPQAPVATAPEPAPATGGSVDLSLAFAPGSAEPLPDAREQLGKLGRALARTDASLKFKVEGHTDTTGSREQNQELSQRRAAAVVSYLVGKFNLAPNRLEAVGKGEDDLPVPTPENVAEPRNRVVRIVAISD